MHLGQIGSRLRPQFADEVLPRLGVGGECFALPPRSVEGKHEQRREVFPVRVTGGNPPQIRYYMDGRAVAGDAQVGLHPQRGGGESGTCSSRRVAAGRRRMACPAIVPRRRGVGSPPSPSHRFPLRSFPPRKETRTPGSQHSRGQCRAGKQQANSRSASRGRCQAPAVAASHNCAAFLPRWPGDRSSISHRRDPQRRPGCQAARRAQPAEPAISRR
jgi:hypothetical protein